MEVTQSNHHQPAFLWDYDMTEDDVHEALAEGNTTTRHWLIARILESAKYENVWKYLNPQEIAQNFSDLRLKPPVRRAWQRALSTWGYAVP